MRLFQKRRTIEEGQQLRSAANRTAEEFFAIYRRSDATYRRSDVNDPNAMLGRDLLREALMNTNSSADKIAIANRLLDDGADPSLDARPRGLTMLHVFLAFGRDFEAEAPLLQRLLDGGADINRVAGKAGTPLETLAEKFKYSDEVLAPFYDVLLADPRLDPLQPSYFKRTVLGNIRMWSKRRPDLLARLERLLEERGIPIPPDDQQTK